MVFLKTRQPPRTRLLRRFTLVRVYVYTYIRARLILGHPGFQLRTDFRFHLKRFLNTSGGKFIVLSAFDRYKYCIIIKHLKSENGGECHTRGDGYAMSCRVAHSIILYYTITLCIAIITR